MFALVSTKDRQRPVQLCEVEEPWPSYEQLLIAVDAFSLNRGELSLLERRPVGWRPGQDVAGTVIRDAGDSGFAAGTRVVALVDQAGWAERVCVDPARIAAIPDSVGTPEAAAIPIAGLTALRALRLGGLLLGRQVLVTGASGGVGTFAIQLARICGAIVTGLVNQPDRVRAVRALGADRVANAFEELGGPFDLILEGVGGSTLGASVRHLAPGGVLVLYGLAAEERTPLSLVDFAGRPGTRIHSFFVHQTCDTRSFADDLKLLVGLVANGDLKPQIGLEASWRDMPEVITALRERQFAGKAVLHRD